MQEPPGTPAIGQPQLSLVDQQTFGRLKQTRPLAQVKLPGLAKVDWSFVFSCRAHNLLRLPRLIATRGQRENDVRWGYSTSSWSRLGLPSWLSTSGAET